MAFHVACPITCRRICYCTLGFPANLQSAKAKTEFAREIDQIEEFLKDPWGIRVLGESTVQVSVPKVVPPPQPQQTAATTLVADGGSAVDEAAAVSERAKRLALQKKAAVDVVAAEDYARRFESGDKMVVTKAATGEEQDLSNGNVMCRMCFVGENEGSERARKMLSCKSCGKKYHSNCLKTWSQHRDLFHWSSWTCPSCRTCEVCRRTGDPNKFMFCKRCDGAHHCYCQHPPHKNVGSGPYLCPKHTRCHSCASTVPGNGLSVRWFLGYTCCDACGRLFVKGNYCPVCLKVYRDSESTPMVCCDNCQRWVHCQCDGISDARYHQFQVDENLRYKCATCRGECYQVKDVEDGVQELWRRRDKTDQDLIASLRAAAGLPTQEDIFAISLYSDDEENVPVAKNEFGRSIKLSLKGLSDKSPKKTKDYGKKHSNKKHGQKKSKAEQDRIFEGHHDVQFLEHQFDEKKDRIPSHRIEGYASSPVTGIVNRTEGICSINQSGVFKHKFVDDVMASDEDKRPRVVKFKSSKSLGLDTEDDGANKSKAAVKAKKIVINLGARKINMTSSPGSDTSSFQREKDLLAPNGVKVHHSSQLKGLKSSGKEPHIIKYGKVRSHVSDFDSKLGRGSSSAEAVLPADNLVSLRTRSIETNGATFGTVGRVIPSSRGDKGNGDDYINPSSSQPIRKDSKPLLKFKLKKPSADNQNSQAPPLRGEERSSLNHPLEQRSLLNYPEEEKIFVKGQRSKRKRPSSFMEKTTFNEDEDVHVSQSHQDGLKDEIMDGNWILRKLGKDAIGKRVEVHQPSDNTWHKGVVTDFGGSSTLFVTLDSGNLKALELGKQGVRFIPHKQKRSRT